VIGLTVSQAIPDAEQRGFVQLLDGSLQREGICGLGLGTGSRSLSVAARGLPSLLLAQMRFGAPSLAIRAIIAEGVLPVLEDSCETLARVLTESFLVRSDLEQSGIQRDEQYDETAHKRAKGYVAEKFPIDFSSAAKIFERVYGYRSSI
jgi:hypothetical protein